MDRRRFLRGVASCAVAVTLPIPAPLADYAVSFEPSGPVFEGAVGVYRGVIIRQAVDLRASARASLAHWAGQAEMRRAGGLFIQELISAEVDDGPTA